MRLILSVFSVLVLTLSSALAINLTERHTWVSDYAHIFSDAERADLEKILADEQVATSNQVFVLTVENTQGLEMWDFSQKVFERWKPGVKNKTETKNNGVLIVRDATKRITRIHPGYGLEGALPDIVCHQITDKMATYFRRGEFYPGFKVGIAEVLKRIHGEYKPTAKKDDPHSNSLIIFFIIATVVVLGGVLIYALLRRQSEPESDEVPEPFDSTSLRRAYPERSGSRRRTEDGESSVFDGISQSETVGDIFGNSPSESKSNEIETPSVEVAGGGGEAEGAGAETQD